MLLGRLIALVTGVATAVGGVAAVILPLRFFLKILANFSGRNELLLALLGLLTSAAAASALSRFFCLARDLVPGPARASTT